jgi:hypothetical protein
MFLDYYLTIVGAYLYQRVHQNADTKEYELNPVFKNSVGSLHLFDLHHFISVAVITFILVIISEKNVTTQATLEFMVGSLAIPLAAANGRHIANILTFLYSEQHPDQISGQTQVASTFRIKISQYHILFLLFPLLVIGFAQPTSFIFGGIAATIILILYHQIWLARSKKNNS